MTAVILPLGYLVTVKNQHYLARDHATLIQAFGAERPFKLRRTQLSVVMSEAWQSGQVIPVADLDQHDQNFLLRDANPLGIACGVLPGA